MLKSDRVIFVSV